MALNESEELGELLEWSAEAVALTRPIVERAGDGIAVCLREALHRGALGQVLANQSVRVLVGSTFPGVVGSGEINRNAGDARDLVEPVELAAVVGGDGFEQVWVRLDELDEPGVERSDVASTQFADQHRAGGPFDEAQDAVVIAGTVHRIHLPVADLFAGLDDGGALGDVSFAGNVAALLVGVVALPAFERLTQMAPELSAAVLVAPDVEVDRLVADLQHAGKLEPPADLFRAELVAQQPLDQSPFRRAEAAVSTGHPPSSIGVFLSLAGPIEAIVARAVAAEFAADRAPVTTHQSRDFSVRTTLLPKHPQRISLLRGDLVIWH